SADDCSTLIIAGGVGTNCKLLGALMKAFPERRIRAPYAPGDTGQAIGNVIFGLTAHGHRVPETLRSPFLGTAASTADVEAFWPNAIGSRHLDDPDVAQAAFQFLDRGGIRVV